MIKEFLVGLTIVLLSPLLLLTLPFMLIKGIREVGREFLNNRKNL